MICEKCKREFNNLSKTRKEAMKKYTVRLKKDNKKFKEINDTSK